MQYFSTKNKNKAYSFKEAVIKGLPEDNGLFMPESIPQLDKSFFASLPEKSLPEIGIEVAKPFVKDDIPEGQLEEIISGTLAFPIPVQQVTDSIYSLELFHGPTCAFKDVGARFLARCLSYFSAKQQEKVTVLVATSGDTGSAVANGFLGVPNVDVVILYPKGKVSHLQEQQLTTLRQNITALEIDGTFDDCQKMVKAAFLDKALNGKMKLTSANSINMARLLPQSFYYFWAMAQLNTDKPVTFAVPSGNYGNITAGLLAQQMGLPIQHFIAASNINKIVPDYLASGLFEALPSKHTISNAMDVGNPSNFDRMLAIYGQSWEQMKSNITGFSATDTETKETMKSVFDAHGYVLDPHGAIGFRALQQHLGKGVGVFLETAHPAKFLDVVEPVVGKTAIPERLASYLEKEKKSIEMPAQFEALAEYLLK